MRRLGDTVHEPSDGGTVERTVEDLLTDGRVDEAVEVVAGAWPTLAELDGGRLRRTIDRLPEPAWSRDPWIMAGMGASYRSVDSPSRSAGLPWFRTAEALMAATPPRSTDVARVRIHSSAALRSLGRVGAAASSALSAMELLDEDVELSASVRVASQAQAALQYGLARLHGGAVDDAHRHLRLALGLSERGLTLAQLVECMSGMAAVKYLAGDYRAASGYVAAAREAAGESGLITSAFGAGALVVDTLVAIEQNRLDDARAVSGALAIAAHHSDWEPFAEFAAATYALVDGRHVEGLDHVRRCLASAREWDEAPFVTSLAELMRGVILMHLGEFAASVAVFESVEPSADHAVCPDRLIAGVRYKAGDAGGCLQALRACETLGEKHAARSGLDVLLLSAAANYDLDNVASADVAMDRALHLAAVNDAYIPFVLISPIAMQRMLARASDRQQPARVIALLDEMRTGIESAPLAGSLEPLSERELDVAQQLFEDKTVSQIASELYISTNTVKTHVRSIYRKLAANNRRDAVRRVKELGLSLDITRP